MMNDLIVVGAGAAGLLSAGMAAKQGLYVLLIEKNDTLGKKLRITGKGRCNITNDCDLYTLISSISSNGKFLYSAFSSFSTKDLMDFFEDQGLPLKVERGNRVFPKSDLAQDVVNCLVSFVKQNHAKIIKDKVEHLLIDGSQIQGVKTQKGQRYFAKRVLLATGGASYPETGSDGFGYHLAKEAGHTIINLRPSLVPLVCKGFDCEKMQGLSLKNISIQVIDTKKKRIYKDFGEMLFTHFGVSGPVILSASSHMRNMEEDRYILEIDLKPALTIEQLDRRIQRVFLENRNRDFSNALRKLLPQSMLTVVMKRSRIPENIKCHSISKEDRLRLEKTLKYFSFTIQGFRSLNEAIITSGGVKVKEVDPKTMESKKISGLYFAGEILDVDAYTGGFNLQIAFSTAYQAVLSMKNIGE